MTQRKPPELKVLAGTARPDRDEGNVASLLPRLEIVPSPPDWMKSPAAVREWAHLAPMLVSCGVLRATMVSSLAHLCQIHAALVDAYGSAAPPPAALVAAYTRLAGLFGLTAVDAKRLASAAGQKPGNKYARFKGR